MLLVLAHKNLRNMHYLHQIFHKVRSIFKHNDNLQVGLQQIKCTQWYKKLVESFLKIVQCFLLPSHNCTNWNMYMIHSKSHNFLFTLINAIFYYQFHIQNFTFFSCHHNALVKQWRDSQPHHLQNQKNIPKSSSCTKTKNKEALDMSAIDYNADLCLVSA